MSGPSLEQSASDWASWIGRSEARTEIIDAEAVRRFACAIGETSAVEDVFPSLGHWACFLPTAEAREIGPDGHPFRGGLMPPVMLPRRMFASSAIVFERALGFGAMATLTTTIRDVRHKAGRSGDLVFVDVARDIAQSGALCVSELQTIVYRGAGAPMEPVVDAFVAPEEAEVWRPGPIDLFRFSAVTFNAHRIHYDLPYATGEEGYPGLVVHGPFTAAKLFAYARRAFGVGPRRFTFRGQAPLIADQPIVFRQGDGEGEVVAVRCDGAIAMTAHTQV